MQEDGVEDPPRRKRGRPRKDVTGNGAVKRPPGRPRKEATSATVSPKRGRGRPRKDRVDPEILQGLARIFCTVEVAAGVFGITEQNLRHHMEQKPELAKVWYQGGLQAKANLHRLQWTHAQRPDAGGVQMTIHMSKHYLGQIDRILVSVEDMVQHFDKLTDSQIDAVIRLQKQALAALAARAADGIDPNDGGDPAATRH